MLQTVWEIISAHYLHGSVIRETKVAGNHSVQFRVTIVAQQLLHVTECVTSGSKQRHFSTKTGCFQFHETDLLQPVS
jgi:hypothetical protein